MLNKRSSRFNMPPGAGFPNPMTPPPMPHGPGPMPGGQPYFNEPNLQQPGQSSLYPGFQMERLFQEVRENRRRIDNLARRVSRIENYLQIRDNNDLDYSNDDKYSF